MVKDSPVLLEATTSSTLSIGVASGSVLKLSVPSMVTDTGQFVTWLLDENEQAPFLVKDYVKGCDDFLDGIFIVWGRAVLGPGRKRRICVRYQQQSYFPGRTGPVH